MLDGAPGQPHQTPVCMVRHNYYPNGHIHRNARALARSGYDVSVIVLRRAGEPAHEYTDGVSIYRLPLSHRRAGFGRYVGEYLAFILMAFGTVTRLHMRKRFRVVQVDNMPDVLVFSALVPKLSGARVILYIADNMPELMVDTRRLSPAHPVVRLLCRLQRISADFADHVLVPNVPTGRVVQARGVPNTKITPVLNCPDDALFTRLAPRTWDPRSGSLRIVTHGTLAEHYGIQVLIEALPGIARLVPGVHVDIFGDGEYRPALEALTAHRGVAGRVRFHGAVPQTAIPAYLAQADIAYTGLLCDLFLANKTLEYLALGLPLAISRWPAHEEYLPESCVAYFRPGDVADLTRAILDLYHDPREAQRKADSAADLFDRKYRWSIQQQAYLKVVAAARRNA